MRSLRWTKCNISRFLTLGEARYSLRRLLGEGVYNNKEWGLVVFFSELDTLHCIHLINITPFFGTQLYKVKTRAVNTRLNETADQERPGKKIGEGST